MRPRFLVPALLACLAASTATMLPTACSSESAYATMSGKEIYGRRCEQCHGPRGLALTGRANSYKGKREYWTQASLIAYLENPASYKKTMPHLADSKKFMPKQLQYVPDDARKRLADYVLGLMDALE